MRILHRLLLFSILKRLFYIIAFALFCSLGLNAQDYPLQINNDEKVIFVDSLGLAQNTTVYEVLKILPEMLSRQGSYLVSNYSVRVNDVPVGGLNDAILSQLHISDVYKIVLSVSSASSFTNNGESGSINVILRETDRLISGNVALDVAYPVDIIPGFLVSINKGKWRVNTLFKGDYYNPSPTLVDVTNDYDAPEEHYSSKIKYAGETAHISAVRTGSKDKFTICFSESSSTSYSREDELENTTNSLNLRGYVKYERNFDKGAGLCVESEYNYNAKANHEVREKVEYIQPVVRNNILTFKLGENASYDSVVPSGIQSAFVMPYFRVEGTAGQWSYLTELDMQYYLYDVEGIGKSSHFDLTGLAAVRWQFTDHQMFRLLADRKIMRQDALSVNPVKLSSVSLDYIINGNVTDGAWMFNPSVGYIHVDDIVSTVSKPYDTDDMLNLDLLARFQKGVFALSFTSNLFYSMLHDNGYDAGHALYYNLSLMPSLNFSTGTHFVAGLTYNSKLIRSFQSNGDNAFMLLSIGQELGPVYLHLYGTINFLGRTTDMEYRVLGNVYKTYALIRNNVGLGVSYNF